MSLKIKTVERIAKFVRDVGLIIWVRFSVPSIARKSSSDRLTTNANDGRTRRMRCTALTINAEMRLKCSQTREHSALRGESHVRLAY